MQTKTRQRFTRSRKRIIFNRIIDFLNQQTCLFSSFRWCLAVGASFSFFGGGWSQCPTDVTSEWGYRRQNMSVHDDEMSQWRLSLGVHSRHRGLPGFSERFRHENSISVSILARLPCGRARCEISRHHFSAIWFLSDEGKYDLDDDVENFHPTAEHFSSILSFLARREKKIFF